MTIDAPASDVWDAIDLRPRSDYFAATINRITAVPGTDDEFHLHFDAKFHDQADTPKALSAPKHLHLKVVEKAANAYLSYFPVNRGSLPLFGKDNILTEYFLRETPEGTAITLVETFGRVTLVTFLALLFLNPARDGLVSLKAQIEGTENPSVLAQWANGTTEDGAPPANVRSAIWLSGVVAMVAVTGATALVLWLVMTFIIR